jgi:hypothetical protein
MLGGSFIYKNLLRLEIEKPPELEVYEDIFYEEVGMWALDDGWVFERIDNNTVLRGRGHRWAVLEDRDWRDFSFGFKFKRLNGSLHANFRARFEEEFKRYFVGVHPDGILYLHKQIGEVVEEPKSASLEFELDESWHTLEVKVFEGLINVYFDDALILIHEDPNPIFSGGIAFETLENSEFLIDEVRVSSVTEDELFRKLPELPLLRLENATRKGGALRRDEIWAGEIFVKECVIVPEGKTLTIEPGTTVKFKHFRGYKYPSRGCLLVKGGTVKAIGTPDKQIWFTSDAKDPINGDWAGILIHNSKDSEFEYVIVEYGELGIAQDDSEVDVSHSIIRWSNSEGLYAERSKATFEYNLFYGNGYHAIALEQYNDMRILNNVFRDEHFGVHHEKTKALIEGNYFKNVEYEGITAGMESSIIVRRNRFENIGFGFEEADLRAVSVSADPDSELILEDNDFGEGFLPVPELDFEDVKRTELGYIPGDPEDKFMYVFDEADETRRVVKKIGKGLSFGFALEYADGYLWRFSIGSGELGKSLDFIKIDPGTSEYWKYANDEIMNPRGLAWDGEYFWVNDFSLLRIFKFELAGNRVNILKTFDIPEKEKGGTMGLTTDGDFLYLRSRDGSKIYKLDRDGNVLDEIYFEWPIGGAIVWTGTHFWARGGCGKDLCKFTKDGKLAGEIWPPAIGPWALAWDGKYLWTIQRTNELWDDPKIYQIEILDDSLDENARHKSN